MAYKDREDEIIQSGIGQLEMAYNKIPFKLKGYGYHALVLMLNVLTALTGRSTYRSRVDSDNYASQNLMKKLGAKPNGISEIFLHGEELQKF